MERSGKKLASRSINDYKFNVMLCFSELDRKVKELDEPEMTEESILDFINKITNLYSEVMVDCFGECITEDVGCDSNEKNYQESKLKK